jgi:hypothetical protein
MNRKPYFFAVLLIVAGVLAFTGCLSSGNVAVDRSDSGPFGEHYRTPVKDFVTLGIVFTENQFQVDSSGFLSGNIFTYQELLKAAQDLGGDAIINVVIEQRNDTESSGLSSIREETWYGSALAIKYTDTLRRIETTTIHDASASMTTVTTTEEVYFNDAGGQSPPEGGAANPAATAQSSSGGSLRDRLLGGK